MHAPVLPHDWSEYRTGITSLRRILFTNWWEIRLLWQTKIRGTLLLASCCFFLRYYNVQYDLHFRDLSEILNSVTKWRKRWRIYWSNDCAHAYIDSGSHHLSLLARLLTVTSLQRGRLSVVANVVASEQAASHWQRFDNLDELCCWYTIAGTSTFLWYNPTRNHKRRAVIDRQDACWESLHTFND